MNNEELQKEFDRIFNLLFLANEENKRLLKEVKKLERKNAMLKDRLLDLSNRYGCDIKL